MRVIRGHPTALTNRGEVIVGVLGKQARPPAAAMIIRLRNCTADRPITA